MTNSQRLDAVRTFLETWFSSEHPGQEWNVIESILVSDGCYCGRRFSFEPYSAVWFLEENQVKVFASDGTVASCVNGDDLFAVEPEIQIRRAA